ncbi:hypothetical protein T484DRAFT_1613156, partial [Baffinella frigidus]
TRHPTPFTLHPSPYTLYPTPHTLHPTPYTLHHTPYTLHPTPYTLNAPPPTQTASRSNARDRGGPLRNQRQVPHYPRGRGCHMGPPRSGQGRPLRPQS